MAVMNQAKIIQLYSVLKDEYGNPIENLTITDVQEYFGTPYRSCADILSRMAEKDILDKHKDGRTIYYSHNKREPLSEEEIEQLFSSLVEVCQINSVDPSCEMILKTIVERDGGLMPDYSIKKDKNGNPKVHTRGKQKGQIIKKKNGGFGYLVKSIFTVMHDYNIL